MNPSKISSIVMYALILVGIIVLIMSFSEVYDPILYVSYLFMGLTVLAMIGGAVAGIVNKPQSARGILVGVGGLVVVLLAGYVLSDGNDYETYKTTYAMSKLSGTLLYSLYVLFGLSIVSIVASAVMKYTR